MKNIEAVFSDAAAADLAEIIEWYNNERAGLGDEFFAEVKSIISFITQNPRLYPIIKKNFRKVLAKRFPYALFYEAGSELVTVVGIFHTSRSPLLVRRRLG